MRPPRALILALAASALSVAAALPAQPAVQFSVFTHTPLRLTDIVWTGRQLLYVDNTTNRVFASPPDGQPLTLFAAMPKVVEETRCSTAPGSHGFASGDIYCHAPDNKIYRIRAGGKSLSVFAVLPHLPTADGALTFDQVGRFGYDLVVATGRSGGPTPRGGSVFTVDAAGKVTLVGTYGDPGGADEVAVAPAGFGTVAGDALLTVDAGKTGTVVAMDAHGRAKTLVKLPDGPNPIVVPSDTQTPPAGAARPGLYVTDTLSHDVFFAPAADFTAYTDDVLVGSELRALFWAIQPSGTGFTAVKLSTNLTGKSYNLEGATYIAG